MSLPTCRPQGTAPRGALAAWPSRKRSWGLAPRPPRTCHAKTQTLKVTVAHHLPLDFSLSAGFI